MDLKDVLTALQAVKTEQYPEGIVVAVDLGVHKYCLIESNCPRAVQLRKVLSDAGISLAELFEAYESSRHSVQAPINYTVPEFDSNLLLYIGGQEITIDLKQALTEELKVAVESKLDVLNRMRSQVENMGLNLHRAYLNEIRKTRDTFVLPQLTYNPGDLLQNRCITTVINNQYTYLIPITYQPQYLIRGGVRYKMKAEDVDDLRRDVYVRYIMTSENTFSSITLVDIYGGKFHHYHGGSYDCWGLVRIPERWDGLLTSLTVLARLLEVSLITINVDSLISNHPEDMPGVHDLTDRSTELGREGEFSDQQRQVDENGQPIVVADDDDEEITPEGETTTAPLVNRWGAGATRRE